MSFSFPVSFCSFLSFLFSSKALPMKGKLPPGPIGLPIIRNLHQLVNYSSQKYIFINSLKRQEYGPVMFIRFGVVPVVVLSTKEAAEEVLKTHDLSSLVPDQS
ncbi:unnamed protein product [Microthlaspi erraticum]|uniref:Uncharacterized protein n=1 Tax=Microthlaspi erraticum TaxID=1685480 RepID=A0A6D2L790_9BRAS|nr:unnamed protein product [Microthlaspi erraticum]